MAVTDCANGFRAVAVHRAAQEPVQKHRFSGFFGTDLDMILRGWGTDTVIISGATTENCCHATARDALFRDYRLVFLSDATATFDYPDREFGEMSAAEVHRATLLAQIYEPESALRRAVDAQHLLAPAPPFRLLRQFAVRAQAV